MERPTLSDMVIQLMKGRRQGASYGIAKLVESRSIEDTPHKCDPGQYLSARMGRRSALERSLISGGLQGSQAQKVCNDAPLFVLFYSKSCSSHNESHSPQL